MPYPQPSMNHPMGEDRHQQEQLRAEAQNRWHQSNMRATDNYPSELPAPPSVLVQIEALSNQCSLLRDEVSSMNEALGAILRPEEPCTAESPPHTRSGSPVQSRLIELTRHVEESTMLLRDLRRRIDL